MGTDGLRLAIGTFTRIPVPAPREVGRREARAAMLLGPVVILLPALAIGAAAQVLANLTPTPGVVAAVLALAALAWITRALHLDGLADTADALGSGRPAPEALEIARRSDIGPFGVVTLVLVLLLQALCLGDLLERGAGAGALVVAVVVGRIAMAVSCTPMLPAARPGGLGATVAGSVPGWAAWATAAGWLLLFAGSVGRAHGAGSALATAAAVAAGLGLAMVISLIARRRLGGITGDTLGAAGEIAATAVLVILVAT